ncbi:MAG: hypothetical protein AAF389_14340 [Gemmatimonadota bacterium]
MRTLRTAASVSPVVAAIALLSFSPTSIAAQQDTDQLFSGDSVRVFVNAEVDGITLTEEFIGRIVSLDGSTANLVRRGQPTCRASLDHGAPPICDPAPLIRRTFDLSDATVQRRQQKGNLPLRMVIAGVAGGAAVGAIGYAVGPSLGFGKVGGCREPTGTRLCSAFAGLGPEELRAAQAEQERQQTISDQRRGAFFFGLVGASAGIILIRKLSVGWVDVNPVFPTAPADGWGINARVPTGF